MGQIVIACYRPKRGRDAQLLRLMAEHVPILRSVGLATDRASIMGRAKDGTIVEVFEWVSPEAIQRAHEDPTVLAMWGRYEEVCDYVRLTDLAESAELFAGFEAI